MPGKLLVPHHTITDWDFKDGSTARSLANDYFVSAPTSLKYVWPPGYWETVVLCRIPGTLCLPQGELRTWVRTTSAFQYLCTFRNQAALGSANVLNCYNTYLSGNRLYWHRQVAGVETFVEWTASFTRTNEWVHYRFVWYIGLTPGEETALCLDHYRDIAGEWVKLGETMYDTQNLWVDSEINRCGFQPFVGYTWTDWFDDTEIWGPV
ncbi:hypothetical protein ES703_92255 [subsurface metagenome]